MGVATLVRMRCVAGLLALVILTTSAKADAEEKQGVVRVHIVAGKRKVRLRKPSSSLAKSRVVCTSPCGRVIDARGGDLYFEGDGFPDSAPFSLADARGDLTARVRPGSWGLLVGGRIMEGFGTGLLVFGLVVFGAALQAEHDESPFHVGWKIAAPIAAVSGAGLVLGGLWMVRDSATTFTLERR